MRVSECIASRNVAVMTMNFHEARIEEIKVEDAIAIEQEKVEEIF